jgi:hypothetical protein
VNTELIEKEFDKSDLEQKPGPYGKLLTYVATPAYVRRMNDIFDYRWSTEVQKIDVYDSELVAVVKVTADGISKTQAGGKHITRDKEGNALCLGDDAKSAISTAFKKACQLFGIGLYLAEDDTSPASGNGNGSNGNSKPEKTTTKTSGGISDAQLGLVKKLRTELGWSADEVTALAQRMFKTEVPSLNKTQASGLIAALKKQGEAKDAGEDDEAPF